MSNNNMITSRISCASVVSTSSSSDASFTTASTANKSRGTKSTKSGNSRSLRAATIMEILRSSDKENNNESSNNTDNAKSTNTLSSMFSRLRGSDTSNNEELTHQVKVLFPNTGIIYEGPMIVDTTTRHGEGGICTWPDGMKFLGRFDYDEPVEGTLITAAYTYTGKLRQMKFHGNAVICYSDNSTYEGEFLDGKFHGAGKWKRKDIGTYCGDFVNGEMEGIGNLVETDGISCYSGVWKNSKKEGEGSETLANGEIYHGQFYRNKRNGNGCLITKDKIKMEGTFRNGVPLDGPGWEITFPDGKKFTGDAVRGKPCGSGTMRYADESVYTGEWINGLRHGNGICIYANGDTLDGYWEKDEHVNIKMDLGKLEFMQDTELETPAQSNDQSTKFTTPEDIDCNESTADLSQITDGFTVAESKTSFDVSLQSPTIQYPNGDSFYGTLDRRKLRQGHGIYIDHHNRTTYEGQFKNSKRHGKGTLTTPNSKYEGEFSEDYIHGAGTIIYNDNSTYTGRFCLGKFHGKGALTDANGMVFKGVFDEGVKQGNGEEIDPVECNHYIGEFSKDKRNGFGTLMSLDGNSVLYTGLWKDGLFDGEGVLFYNDDTLDKFEGCFLRGQQSGEGMLSLKDGHVLRGNWIRDSPVDGMWEITYPDSSTFEGMASFFSHISLLVPTRHGDGKMYYENGDEYSGNFVHNKREGKGKCVYSNGDIWDGEWKNDEFDDCEGVLILADGTVERFYGSN